MEGWIKLYRKLIDSQMYKSLNSKQRDVMIQCLLLANHKENEWEWGNEKHKCNPGEFITSLESLKNHCAKDVKVQSVRTALLKLEKWCFLTNESTKTGRLVKIINWGMYQGDDIKTNKETNKEPTKSQQRANKELTTNKNDKNDKNDKNQKNARARDLHINNIIKYINEKLKFQVKKRDDIPQLKELIQIHGEEQIKKAVDRMETYWKEVKFRGWKNYVYGKRWSNMADNIAVFLTDEDFKLKLESLARGNKTSKFMSIVSEDSKEGYDNAM